MAVYPVRKRLPVAYSTEIGRIIFRWAFLESRLRATAFLLLELHPKIGRLTVRTPRTTDYLEMLFDIIKVRNIKTTVDIKMLRKAIKDLSFYRDALAHGIWIKHEKTKLPVLQVLSGSYPPMPGQKKVRARIDPQAVMITVDTLRTIRNNINAAVSHIEKMKKETAIQLKTSRRKSLGQ